IVESIRFAELHLARKQSQPAPKRSLEKPKEVEVLLGGAGCSPHTCKLPMYSTDMHWRGVTLVRYPPDVLTFIATYVKNFPSFFVDELRGALKKQ
ncbi:TPA: hypothetical protein N0F65_001589, partial [Lagenidium giganteum]